MRAQSLENLSFKAPPGKRLVVLGDPISHSLSPAMHNAALREMARSHPDLDGWAYSAVHVPADRLKEALETLHAAGVFGINLTLPHKVRALELVEEIDPSVRAMGAVNTLIRTDNAYRATNTDGYGIGKAILEAFGKPLKGQDIWLFGAGGAARGIVVACLQAGCHRLTVVNRSEERLGELEEQLYGFDCGTVELRFCLSASAPDDQAEQSILINATSLGLKDSDPCPIAETYLRRGACVYDTTYGVRNKLAALSSREGIPYADGLSMLVWQGARSLEIWTGHPVPAETMRKAAEAQLMERTQNG
ncbi:shikimate dehydrogenase [Puniceicoccales bacterium CK1056]|uniref:Shikimate dehydrogenase (NADP(+)) n=1 Tax=Oceanipulchritudo coccoides TaxID=2706888 RepID=A0A6B2LY46_9BACT|nr:shikimate dehydrogenase [Oceanipulchritudo coccoides]NDV61042.1 shikimate dehydrogenase [Oceanipulchritudo coccoides]